MDVRLIDPRDTGWEITSPSFRVYFWEPQPPPPGFPDHPGGYHSAEYEVSDVDVGEVLAWAETTATRGSTYTVYAVVDHCGERGLVRLAGVDPTAAQDAPKRKAGPSARGAPSRSVWRNVARRRVAMGGAREGRRERPY
jgi:hypothetical protein